MTLSQRLRTCAKHTGLDAVIELLQEAADEIDALQARAQVQGDPVAWMHWLNGPVRVFMNKDEAMMELDRLNREYPVDSGDRKMRPLILGDTTPQPAQATQAEVTDAAIDAATRHIYHNGRPASKEYRVGIARAILALRPERVPMTGEQISLEAHNADEGDWNDLRFRSSWHEGFLEGARFAEAHHGITAQTQKEGA